MLEDVIHEFQFSRKPRASHTPAQSKSIIDLVIYGPPMLIEPRSMGDARMNHLFRELLARQPIISLTAENR